MTKRLSIQQVVAMAEKHLLETVPKTSNGNVRQYFRWPNRNISNREIDMFIKNFPEWKRVTFVPGVFPGFYFESGDDHCHILVEKQGSIHRSSGIKSDVIQDSFPIGPLRLY